MKALRGKAGGGRMTETLLERRARLMGPNVPTFYRTPVHIVRGEGVWLWDAGGKRYLDCYNNVPHVGHCHPGWWRRSARRRATLNTHTRYLHDLVLDYIERLTATFGPRDFSGDPDLHGVRGERHRAAHGAGGDGQDRHHRHRQHLSRQHQAVSQLSTRSPPIGGRWPHVRLVPAPDPLRPAAGPGGAGAASPPRSRGPSPSWRRRATAFRA